MASVGACDRCGGTGWIPLFGERGSTIGVRARRCTTVVDVSPVALTTAAER